MKIRRRAEGERRWLLDSKLCRVLVQSFEPKSFVFEDVSRFIFLPRHGFELTFRYF